MLQVRAIAPPLARLVEAQASEGAGVASPASHFESFFASMTGCR
jgi:hypothetical protein